MEWTKILAKDGTLFGIVMGAFISIVLWYGRVNSTNDFTAERIERIESHQKLQDDKIESIELSTARDIGDIKGDVKEIKAMIKDIH